MDGNPLIPPQILGEWRIPDDTRSQVNIGLWQCDLNARTILLDSSCAAMLGYTSDGPKVLSLDEWKELLHPEEGGPKECRYRIMFECPTMGDTIDDELRIRRCDGKHVALTMRASVMARDEKGKALSLIGLLWNPQSMNKTAHSTNNGQADSGRLLFAIRSTGDGLWDWDSKTDSVYYSPRYLEMLGYTAEEFPGDLETWKQKIHIDDRDNIVIPQAQVVESARYGDTFECTYRIKHKNGSWVWILGRGFVTHRGEDGKATRLVGLHTDITTVQSGREKLEELVKNDALTGLRSRAFCDLEIERLDNAGIRPVCVVSCDIDGLKLINDYLGHAEGDKLLMRAAALMRRPLRATDCVARMGGDEFVIILPHCGLERAENVVKELKLTLSDGNAGLTEVPVLASFGLAWTDQEDVPVARLLMAADRKMLREKSMHRVAAHRCIRDWIERNKHIEVSLEDNRYS